MTRHIDGRLLVRCAAIVDDEFIFFRKAVLHVHVQFAREAFLVVGRDVTQNEFVLVDLLCIPDTCMESRWTSMKMIRAIVNSKVVIFAIHYKLTFADAVAITSNERA